MTNPLVFKDEHGCHVRIDGRWWHNFTPYLTRCLLKAHGFPNAVAIVRDAPHPRSFDVDFDGRWVVNGRHVSERRVRTALRQTGLDDFAVETVMRIHKKCYQIEKELQCS
jgi:hypothetical protein